MRLLSADFSGAVFFGLHEQKHKDPCTQSALLALISSGLPLTFNLAFGSAHYSLELKTGNYQWLIIALSVSKDVSNSSYVRVHLDLYKGHLNLYAMYQSLFLHYNDFVLKMTICVSIRCGKSMSPRVCLLL